MNLLEKLASMSILRVEERLKLLSLNSTQLWLPYHLEGLIGNLNGKPIQRLSETPF